MATVSTILFHGFERPMASLASDHDVDLRPVLGARTHAMIVVGMVTLVVYASLFPFAFENRSLTDAAAQVEAGFRNHPIDAGDFLVNILLFVPLGYFLIGTLRVDRAGGSLLATSAALAVSAALSVSVEMLQAFFPPRTPCLNDVMAQILGACLGVVAWEFGGRRLTARFRRAWASGDLRDNAGLMLLGYVCILAAATLLPFDLDVRPDVLGRKLNGALARLLNLDMAPAGITAYLWDLLSLAPAGVLAAFVTRRGGRRGEGHRALRLGLAIVLVTTLASLVVRDKRFDSFAVAIQLTGYGLGWLQGRSMRRCWHSDVDPTTPTRVMVAVSFVAGWCALATTLLHGQPLNFTDNPSLLLDRMRTMNWLPLNDIYGDNYLLVLRRALQHSMLFLTGGATLALGARNVLGKGMTAPAAAVAVFVALLLEVGQLSRPDLQPSVTAVLWQATAAWLGFVAARGLLPMTIAAPQSVPTASVPCTRLRTRAVQPV